MKPTDFAYHLTRYLGEYLPGQRNVSANTVKSYRDTFKLLLTYCCEERGTAPERLILETLSPSLIEDFLLWLERTRNNQGSTRNQRLAAIHAFFRYLQHEEPSCLFTCQRILAIPFKRQARTPVQHLTADALHVLLMQPDQSTREGRRNLTLLCVLYDTGARVQELVDLTVRDVRLEAPAVIRLTGKGRKTRHVPVMSLTVSLLDSYLQEQRLSTPDRLDHPLFYNRQRQKLTRAGVTYVLQKYAAQARAHTSELPETVTPHLLRHSKAMHLLQANVNLIYIRDLLGQGSHLKNQNNQPLLSSDSPRVALTHNGHIPDVERYFAFYQLPRSWEVDSELLLRLTCRHAGRHGVDLPALLRDLAVCAGQLAAVLVAASRPDQVIFIRRDKPLYVAYHSGFQLLAYASEERILQEALSWAAAWAIQPILADTAWVVYRHRLADPEVYSL